MEWGPAGQSVFTRRTRTTQGNAPSCWIRVLMKRSRSSRTLVGGRRKTECYLKGVEEFVKRAASELDKLKKENGTALKRDRYLLAMNLVGTGGGQANVGEVARQLLPRLQKLADAHGVDIAIVEREPAKVSAVQFVRKRLGLGCWPEQMPDIEIAETLGRKARARELVLFLGAGVSRPAGLPDWEGLVKRLWQATELSTREVEFTRSKPK